MTRDDAASWEEDDRVVLDDAVAQELGRMLDLPPATRWRDLGGSWTTNALAEMRGGDPLVARIHQRTTSRVRLAGEQEVRRALASSGIPTVVPLDLPDGTTIGALADGQLVEAEPFVPWDARMDSADRMAAGFGMLARVHDVLHGLDVPAARTVRFANHVAAEDAEPDTVAGAARIRSWHDLALSAFADAVVAHVREVRAREAEEGPAPHLQLVHGDWWDNNVLFRDGGIVAVLDVGFMAERPRIDDLALPVWFFILRDAADPEWDPAAVAALLEAYDTSAEHPLTRAERRLLPLVVARQLAWSVGRWIRILEEDQARDHARSAAEELPRAARVLADLDRWWAALGVVA